MDQNLRAYMRLVAERSREHHQVFEMLYAQGLYGACAAIIRQEIDSLMRVDYLAFSIPVRPLKPQNIRRSYRLWGSLRNAMHGRLSRSLISHR